MDWLNNPTSTLTKPFLNTWQNILMISLKTVIGVWNILNYFSLRVEIDRYILFSKFSFVLEKVTSKINWNLMLFISANKSFNRFLTWGLIIVGLLDLYNLKHRLYNCCTIFRSTWIFFNVWFFKKTFMKWLVKSSFYSFLAENGLIIGFLIKLLRNERSNFFVGNSFFAQFRK